MLGPTDEEILAQFILKVAFSQPSNATNPVLQSVFALAALQFHGSLESFRYKHLAVSSIAKADIDWLDEKTLLQNLTATMLLYHYEVVYSEFVEALFCHGRLMVRYSSHSGQNQEGPG